MLPTLKSHCAAIPCSLRENCYRMQSSSVDDQLWQAIQRGDHSAFKLLFVKYYTPLCEYGLRYLPNEAAVEEVVADAFLKLWQKRLSLTITSSLQAYVYRMVKHQMLGYLRTARDTFATQPLEETALQTPTADLNPFGQLTHQEFLHELEEKINQLPEQRQRIFRLNKLEGWSYAEIAQRLNLSEKTVKNQVFRAVQYLRGTDIASLLMLFFLNL